MANLKRIRDRIKAVKNTRKITEAMRLVAAARVRRAQEQVMATRPFADRLAQVFYRLQTRLRLENVELPLLKQRPIETVGLLVVAGDRGLCGAYNANVIKRTEERVRELQQTGLQVQLYLVGRKVVQYFQRRSAPIAKTYVNLSQIPTAAEAAQIGDQLLSAFLSEKVDKVELIYTRFVSLISSRPVVQSLLPLDPTRLAARDDEIFNLLVRGRVHGRAQQDRCSCLSPAARHDLRAGSGADFGCAPALVHEQSTPAGFAGSSGQRVGGPHDGHEQCQRQRQRTHPHTGPCLQQSSAGGYHPGDPGGSCRS